MPATVSAFHQQLAVGPRSGAGAALLRCGQAGRRQAGKLSDHRRNQLPQKGRAFGWGCPSVVGAAGQGRRLQVAVFAVLSDGQQNVPIDMRLYLPRQWVEDEARCARAGVPPAARQLRSKSEQALDLVRTARARGVRFQWVGVDAGYGKEPAFLRALDDAAVGFVADVPRTQSVWTQRPSWLADPTARTGRPATKRQASSHADTAEQVAQSFRAEDWQRLTLRDSTSGALGWISPVGGSGCGTARKPTRGPGTDHRREVG